MDLLPNFESIYEYMVEKFGNKDIKKVHFIKQMEFRKKSNIGVAFDFRYRRDLDLNKQAKKSHLKVL